MNSNKYNSNLLNNLSLNIMNNNNINIIDIITKQITNNILNIMNNSNTGNYNFINEADKIRKNHYRKKMHYHLFLNQKK